MKFFCKEIGSGSYWPKIAWQLMTLSFASKFVSIYIYIYIELLFSKENLTWSPPFFLGISVWNVAQPPTTIVAGNLEGLNQILICDLWPPHRQHTLSGLFNQLSQSFRLKARAHTYLFWRFLFENACYFTWLYKKDYIVLRLQSTRSSEFRMTVK